MISCFADSLEDRRLILVKMRVARGDDVMILDRSAITALLAKPNKLRGMCKCYAGIS